MMQLGSKGSVQAHQILRLTTTSFNKVAMYKELHESPPRERPKSGAALAIAQVAGEFADVRILSLSGH